MNYRQYDTRDDGGKVTDRLVVVFPRRNACRK